MVISSSPLSLTLEQLAGYGAVLPLEQAASLPLSLSMKQLESGATSPFRFWGKVFTANGRDYLIAQSSPQPHVDKDKIVWEPKTFVTQDGVKWADLDSLDQETATLAEKTAGDCFQGDPAFVHSVPTGRMIVPEPEEEGGEEDDAEKAPQDGNENTENEESKEPQPEIKMITELQRLAALVQAVNAETMVVPKDAFVISSSGKVLPTLGFSGVPFPNKLDSYVHAFAGLSEDKGTPLSEDVNGAWVLRYDRAKNLTILRSLLWPGYFFYLNNESGMYGALYFGSGQRNNLLQFML